MTRPLPQRGDLVGLRAVVMGLGQFGGGVAAARYLAQNGAAVCVTDLRGREELAHSCAALADYPIRFVLGEHREADFESADLVIANPAVAPSHALLERARTCGAQITSEMELFLLGTQATLLLVSGTHGKSSTVTFLHQLLKGWSRPVFLGGNLGHPLVDVPEAWLPAATCVVEISSYQLDALTPDPALAKAHGVGLTGLAPDHLERHGSLRAYFCAKARIFELARRGGVALLPESHADAYPFASYRVEERRDLRWSTYGRTGVQHWDPSAFVVNQARIGCPSPWNLLGDFQRDNVLLALSLALAVGMPPEVAAARLHALNGLPHRLQRLETECGRLVYDNGVSTTPESTLAGVLALPAPAVVLLGGLAKQGLAYPELAQALAQRGDRVHLFGRAAQDLAPVFAASGAHAVPHPDLASALQEAWAETAPGQVLLFSPACASFDAYPNFQARALEFVRRVADFDRATRTLHSGD